MIDDYKVRVLGGLYGALVGDACGVPYEFKNAADIPKHSEIDMIPPIGYDRSWAKIPTGTYSDDGAQLLCLLELLIDDDPITVDGLTKSLQDWMWFGYMSVDRITFDIGSQTSMALRFGIDDCGLDAEQYNGNGSLMRSLPIALIISNPEDIFDAAYWLSGATHPHIRSRLCCAIYCLIAYHMLQGLSVSESVRAALDYADTQGSIHPKAQLELSLIKQHKLYKKTFGSGYVVDSLWSAIEAVDNTSNFEDTIKYAIMYGNDTDTTACIAGGLAGIKYGMGGIPKRWMYGLRGQGTIQSVVGRLMQLCDHQLHYLEKNAYVL
jgi:ADP-ribosylglycohydrolase